MLYRYQTPGVYFEWLDSPATTDLRRTDIAGFIGITARGPLHHPLKVESWTQFVSTFGGHIPQAYTAYAVDGFFANGGRTCWVVRVADPQAAQLASLYLLNGSGQVAGQVMARSPGIWGRELLLTVTATTSDRFTLTIRLLGNGQELWRGLSLNPDDERYYETVLNHPESGSLLVHARQPERTYPPLGASAVEVVEGQVRERRMSGGDDGLVTLRPEHFDGRGFLPTEDGRLLDYEQPWGLAALEDIDEVSIVAAPDIFRRPRPEPARHRKQPPQCDVLGIRREEDRTPDSARGWPPQFSDTEVNELHRQLIAHCERLKDRIAILDTRLEDSSPDVPLEQIIAFRKQFSTSYGALYYPWLQVLDPLQGPGDLTSIPPSGHVAGVYARSDLSTGVHKPPANEALEGIQDVSAVTDPVAYGILNEENINVIRPFGGRGIRVAGARTMESGVLAVRYVNVRRLLMMIEESLIEDDAWAVFEPNNTALWREVERVARGFLDGLWRRGMLDGATAAEAYFVRCDAETNPGFEVDTGRLTCLIGVRPPWPAEFVIVRIGKTENGTEIMETNGAPDG